MKLLVRRAVVFLPGIGLLLAVACWLSACAVSRRAPCDFPRVLLYTETVDSLGLGEFLELAPPEVQTRRQLAARWWRSTEQSRRTTNRLRALHNIVGLVPDEAGAWLRLAALSRLLGDQAAARNQLRAAIGAVRRAPADQRNSLHLRLALQYAWLDHDLGNWPRGLAWVERAQAINPADRRVLLVRGLLEAGAERSLDATWTASEIERYDFFRTDWRWVRGMTEFHQGRLKGAAYRLVDLRPDHLHRADCWNDLGTVYDCLEEWREARHRYRRAFQSLPLPDHSCLSLHERHAPQAATDDEKLPVWLAFDRYYVVGSRLTYAALAVERFEAADDPDEREYWAEAAVQAASVCLRKHIHQAWAWAWRGRVYAQIDLPQLARNDLARARTAFDAANRIDVPTLYWSGYLMLKDELYLAARPLLERAVMADSTSARAWASLGLSLIMTADEATAKAALDRALALDPELAVALYNRGLMHFHAKRWQDAVEDLQEAARLTPDNQEIIALLQRSRLLARRERESEPQGEARDE